MDPKNRESLGTMDVFDDEAVKAICWNVSIIPCNGLILTKFNFSLFICLHLVSFLSIFNVKID